MNSIHVGDVGTVFKMRLLDDETGDPINLGLATLMTLTFRDPLGACVIQTAVLSTDGTDGYIEYVTVAGDLTMAGPWKIQGYAEAGGYENSTEIDTFRVNPNVPCN